MHYHTDTITHGTIFDEPVVGSGGDRLTTCWKNSSFLKQTDRTGLEPGWPTWKTETLTIMLYPHSQIMIEYKTLSKWILYEHNQSSIYKLLYNIPVIFFKRYKCVTWTTTRFRTRSMAGTGIKRGPTPSWSLYLRIKSGTLPASDVQT